MSVSIECIVPAAGLSIRMEKWKPLLPYGSSTIVETSVSHALEFCDRVILVTGYRGEELEKLFACKGDSGGEEEKKQYRGASIVCARNDEYHRGMFSSIQTGAGRVSAPYFFVAHADMPEIPVDLYRMLLDRIEQEGEEVEIVRPLYRGKPGHPVLCRNSVAHTICTEAFDSNMQNVMKRHRTLTVESTWPETLFDIDRPGDLEKQRPF